MNTRPSLCLGLTLALTCLLPTAARADGECKVQLHAIAFIPDQRISGPFALRGSLPPSTTPFVAFHGDGHENFNPGLSARQYSTVTIDLSGQTPTAIYEGTGTSEGYRIACVRASGPAGTYTGWSSSGYVLSEVAERALAFPNGSSRVESSGDGTATVVLEQSTGNPLVPLAPAIDYTYSLTLTRLGDDVQYDLNGDHDGYPGHDLLIGDEPIYGFNPGHELDVYGRRFFRDLGGWESSTEFSQTPLSLLPPEEWHASEQGIVRHACNKTYPNPQDPFVGNPTPPPPPPPKPLSARSCALPQAPTRASFDPNDLTVSPPGIGDAGYVRAPDVQSFLVRFENLAQAQAAAHDVTVTATIDPRLDFDSIDATPDQTSRPALSCIRKDPVSRTVKWTFAGIDLPPNVTAPEGQGYVRFTARATAALPTGATITSRASIVFDENPPIATNVVTQTVDNTPPSPTVDPLPAQSNADFTVTWSEADVGSGVDFTELHASVNGGPWALVTRSAPGQNQFVFHGQPGNSYAFQVTGQDQVGNRELASDTAEATTVVPGATPPDGDPVCVTIRRGELGDIEDTCLSESAPTWPAGGYPMEWTGDSGGRHRTLLRADLSSLPEGATILSAELGVYTTWNEDPSPVAVHRVIAPWSEATATWASFSSPSTYDPAAVATFAAAGPGFNGIDVTALAKGWLDGSIPNDGVLLEEDAHPGVHAYIGSETDSVSLRPRLDVCYVP